MAEEIKVGCARPTGGLVGKEENKQAASETIPTPKGKESTFMIQVGKPAPDFTSPAYHKGTFVSIKLSEYLGKWVVLCFYPGDFTFV